MTTFHPTADAAYGRSTFLRGLSASAVALALASPALASAAASRQSAMRVLALQRLDIGEICDAAFTMDGRSLYYGGSRGQVAGYKNLCYALRDNHVPADQGYAPISVWTNDPAVVGDSTVAGHGRRAQSAGRSQRDRSPQTNASIESAARNSQHMYGRAVDFHVAGVSTDYLYRVARVQAYSGGVGYYSATMAAGSIRTRGFAANGPDRRKERRRHRSERRYYGRRTVR
ncbi:MAG: DUF882 domain-containing protein [Candidatus Eremiobacteraeota bacterium]|nr:DUF882 domain-containing protein [Candidatus Eremiobacteraeota bacterium]